MKPFGIFNLTQLFMWGTRLRDLVYLACRESVRLICSVTLIISKHVFTPFVLSNPIFSCSTKDWDQILGSENFTSETWHINEDTVQISPFKMHSSLKMKFSKNVCGVPLHEISSNFINSPVKSMLNTARLC